MSMLKSYFQHVTCQGSMPSHGGNPGSNPGIATNFLEHLAAAIFSLALNRLIIGPFLTQS
jgi:hypothetical protein